MKVKEKYHARGGFEVTTAQLIERGVDEKRGDLERMQAHIDQLTRIVARLIDQSFLSEDEILDLTGCTQYEVNYD